MLQLEPIGHVRSPFVELADAPRQPAAGGAVGRIELVKGRDLEDAISDLGGFEHIWVLFWFHRAGGYRPKVQPPRSDVRRGVLATRSPHRPNPLGLSLVRLEAIESPRVLRVSDLDMIDGTPVLDIKPYLPYADTAQSGHGWLAADPEPRFEVRWSAAAGEQLDFLGDDGERLRVAVEERLALGPRPHAYRRIKVFGDRRRLAYKDWRVWFVVDGRALVVERIESGYRAQRLLATDEALEPHRRFTARYGFASPER